jgi:glycine/D-amino acid oxidase-like deaminating enzyme
LLGDDDVDWAVVGGGFTGLSAARRLAELLPDDRIAVVEAQRVGFGSSGRNSGFIVDSWHWNEALGVEGTARGVRLQRAGLEQLRDQVREHGIECDWSEIGRLHVAVEPSGLRALDAFRRGLGLMGEPYEELPPDAIPEHIGTRHYRAAIHTPGTVLVQPAALARGLGAHLPPNVVLYEDSPVRTVHLGDPHRLECTEGSVTAKALLLTLGGFTPLFGFLERRMFPLFTFASWTRVLDESERKNAGVGEWGLVPEDRVGTTVRRTRDHRILVRNTVHYSKNLVIDDARWQRIAETHRRSFAARFPDLGDVEFEHTWGGVMGMTLNDTQFFGPVANRVIASCAYNGVGIAMGTAAGSALADLALGRDSRLVDDLRALPGPSWIPGNPMLGIGVRTTVAFMRRRAGAEL